MKFILKNLLTVVVVIFILFLSENIGYMQKANSETPTPFKAKNCIKVTLVSSTDKYELKRNNPISIVIKVKNDSDRIFSIKNNPIIFGLEKIGVENEDFKFGEEYRGRLTEENRFIMLQGKEKILKPNEYIDFVIDITELELVPTHSSINLWDNIYKELEEGEYYLFAKVFLEISKDDKKTTKSFTSNKIVISYKNEITQ